MTDDAHPGTLGAMTDPTCHYCARPAEQECPTCGRLYCSMHGDEVCLRCSAPESVAPSGKVYRGSVLALIAGSLVTLFLLVRPPESKGGDDIVRDLDTPTTSIRATATSTPPVTTTPASTTPAAEVTATPVAGARTHTIASGDTLTTIAELYGVDVDAIIALNPGITADNLPINTVLQIPPAP